MTDKQALKAIAAMVKGQMKSAAFRSALKRLGWSVRASAPHLGVCMRTAYAYARGERPIPQRTAELLAARLRLTRKRQA